MNKKYKRICKHCGKELFYSNKSNYKRANFTNQGCRQCQSGNLTGRKYGKWFVLNRTDKRSGNNSIYYKCKCDCGNIKLVTNESLKNGTSKSCGCLISDNYTNIEEIGLKVVYRDYEYRIKNKYFKEFTLTIEQFKNLINQNCHYCNATPSSYRYFKLGVFIYTGLDRKDSSKGYTLDNVVPCCKKCNYSKQDTPYDIYIKNKGIIINEN